MEPLACPCHFEPRCSYPIQFVQPCTCAQEVAILRIIQPRYYDHTLCQVAIAVGHSEDVPDYMRITLIHSWRIVIRYHLRPAIRNRCPWPISRGMHCLAEIIVIE